MIAAKISVMAFATITGRLLLKMPNSSQSNVPVTNKKYIDSEMLPVSFVRMVFIACGTKEAVVNAAARKPVIVTMYTT
jgi:hypothetical protein